MLHEKAESRAEREGRDRVDARERHLQLIAERGQMDWQKTAGYNWRALIEADIGRYKRVVGDALRSRTDARQTTEVVIACAESHAGAWTPESVSHETG